MGISGKGKFCFQPGPFACEVNVITTTLWKQGLYFAWWYLCPCKPLVLPTFSWSPVFQTEEWTWNHQWYVRLQLPRGPALGLLPSSWNQDPWAPRVWLPDPTPSAESPVPLLCPWEQQLAQWMPQLWEATGVGLSLFEPEGACRTTV